MFYFLVCKEDLLQVIWFPLIWRLTPIVEDVIQRELEFFLQDIEAVATPEEEPRSSEASSSFPIAGHSHIEPIEDPIMAEEPRRVTLEDYSSSTVP